MWNISSILVFVIFIIVLASAAMYTAVYFSRSYRLSYSRIATQKLLAKKERKMSLTSINKNSATVGNIARVAPSETYFPSETKHSLPSESDVSGSERSEDGIREGQLASFPDLEKGSHHQPPPGESPSSVKDSLRSGPQRNGSVCNSTELELAAKRARRKVSKSALMRVTPSIPPVIADDEDAM